MKQSISKLLGTKRVVGCKFGIEFELETHQVLPDVEGWKKELDGSLREGGYEYVLAAPNTASKAYAACKDLYEGVAAYDIQKYGRAGTHIHLNVSDLTPDQALTVFGLLLIYEESIMSVFSEDRQNNYFALPIKACEGYLESLYQALMRYGVSSRWFWRVFSNFKYSNVSCYPIGAKGTIEIRGMHSYPDLKDLKKVLTYLTRIRRQALQFDNLRHAVESFSENSIEVYHDKVFDFSTPTGDKHPMENLRIVMGLAYAQPPKVEPVNFFIDEQEEQFDEF